MRERQTSKQEGIAMKAECPTEISFLTVLYSMYRKQYALQEIESAD